MKPTFLPSPAAFRTWLERYHDSRLELIVGFYKAGSGRPSITWPESVAEAICFGWIDGVRRRVDEVSYTIRFTPRKPDSTWSAVNIRKAQSLIEQGRMVPSGLRAFEARRKGKSGIYSYEQRPDNLVEPYAGMLARNATARKFFSRQTPSYRRAATWWVISAKQEETRLRRVRMLIGLSEKGKLIPQFIRRT